MMNMPLPELHAAWVPELPPPVGMALKKSLQYTTLSLTV